MVAAMNCGASWGSIAKRYKAGTYRFEDLRRLLGQTTEFTKRDFRLGGSFKAVTAISALRRSQPTSLCPVPGAVAFRHHVSLRRRVRNDSPELCSFSSSRRVQSHSEHAHGSVPFKSRQFRRACASLTLIKLKYSSQYGRSSSSGIRQKQTSTQCAVPSCVTRACCISQRYSSPATEPRPSLPSSIALSRASSLPGFTRAFTKYRMASLHCRGIVDL